jgi:hypothetical protein
MQEHERQTLIGHLNASRDRILGVTDRLTPQQWTFRTAEGRWSIAECLEHVIRVENRICGLVGNALREGTAQPERRLTAEELSEKDARISKGAVDRSVARQAPEAVRPEGKLQNGAVLVAEFRNTRERSGEFVRTIEGDLRSHFHPHGGFGEIDCYQWLILLSLHGARHAEQMEEIRAAKGFPA